MDMTHRASCIHQDSRSPDRAPVVHFNVRWAGGRQLLAETLMRPFCRRMHLVARPGWEEWVHSR